MSKPVAAFIAGRTAPPGKRMSYAETIAGKTSGTPKAKISTLKDAGAIINETLFEMVEKS